MAETPVVPKGDFIQFRHVRPDGSNGFDIKIDLDVFGGDNNPFEKGLKTLETVLSMFLSLNQTIDQGTSIKNPLK